MERAVDAVLDLAAGHPCVVTAVVVLLTWFVVRTWPRQPRGRY